MFCDCATVAYRRSGIDSDTGKAYRPYRYMPYHSDEQLFRDYQSCPDGSECLLLPCGKCILCTGRYRRHWVLRCQHELLYHDKSCFLTLTVDDAHIDEVFPRLRRTRLMSDMVTKVVETSQWHSLSHKPWQDFCKRLRINLQRSNKSSKIRYYMCGEYGDHYHRPHYHAIMFGWCPDDLRPLIGKPGLFVSPSLSREWSFGFHTIARVDPSCISYVAGYCDKKMDNARMEWIDNFVAPEYVAMSRRPGLGGKFWQQFHDSDLYPENADGTFARTYACLGKDGKVKMPKYYDDLLALHDPDKYARLIAFRQSAYVDREFDLTSWLDECHRRTAVRLERRKLRDVAFG